MSIEARVSLLVGLSVSCLALSLGAVLLVAEVGSAPWWYAWPVGFVPGFLSALLLWAASDIARTVNW